MEQGSSDRAMRRALEERNCKALQMLIRSGARRMMCIKDGWKEDVVWCIIQLGAFDLLEVCLLEGWWPLMISPNHNYGVFPVYQLYKTEIIFGRRFANLPPSLQSFQDSVKQCRFNCVVILALRKRGFLQFDRFLLREIAYAIWATRRN